MDRGVGSAGFSKLAQQWRERAFRFAYSLTGNADEACDLVQESLRRALFRWSQYDASQPLENWFFAILRHLFLDGAERSGRSRAVSLDAPIRVEDEGATYWADVLPDGGMEMLAALERDEGVDQVRRAMLEIAPEHREILNLCDVEGLSYARIAEILRCPVGTVRSRVSRARRALKASLADYFQESDSGGAQPLGGADWPDGVHEECLFLTEPYIA